MLTREEIYHRIIWSADVEDMPTLRRYLRELPDLKLIKIDRLFVDINDWDVFGVLEDQGIDTFFDAKYTEIPTKLEALARRASRFELWMVNCMAGSLSTGLTESEEPDKIDGLKRFADVCHNAKIRPCAVTVLTTKPPEMAKKEYGRSTEEQVLFYAEILLACGFTDIVCSPQEAAAIRADHRFDDLDLVTPGIRRAGSGSQDQARTNTPAGALKAGASYLVIGRDLTTGNPAENFNAIVEEILAA